ncbi:LAETG motif-containing sortase-dependent surface protein [Streptomyces phaeochromogenes]|uniref:LAETG motif-containing sortase-dependent surface protein n=1 Tax=Streptomyces phaeochromogenes TaxID=1923 RepID=UPI003400D52E|nr:excalibur calcium-binding domain-containing protein [Streptomyces phaeochromogenes]WSW14599.1 excalibur calcium-binding domain-containing protein [Streptomyces phaeochromogenes]
MKLLRKPAAVAVAALALTALSATTAQAHDGNHPFKNCTEAYENGYDNIARGDKHYDNDLDRDQDGIGCDQPPSDFVPAEDQGKDDNGTEDTASDTGEKNTDLAETGGSGATAYIAGGGAAVLLAGGGVLFTVRRRRDAR